MALIKFDENNKKHLSSFEYIAKEAGHANYLANGKVEDYDFAFRELVGKKFGLGSLFIDDPNGCDHELISRDKNTADFAIYYGYEALAGYHEFGVKFSSHLWFDDELNEVIIEPIISSIVEHN